MCQVKHAPPDSYGDCLRACIATVMDVPSEQVPHFADLGVDGEQALEHVRQWLAYRYKSTIATFALPGNEALSEVLEWMGSVNGTVTWLLFGSLTPEGQAPQPGSDHVVVCQGGSVVHNPAWIPCSLKQATSAGIWQIWVVSRL